MRYKYIWTVIWHSYSIDSGGGIMRQFPTLPILLLILLIPIALACNRSFNRDQESYTNNYNNSTGIAVDSAGNVYITGFFRATVDFDPGRQTFELTSNGDMDAFLCKFDPDGRFGWAVTWGGYGRDQTSDIDIDDSGNIYVTGWFMNTVDFQWAETWG